MSTNYFQTLDLLRSNVSDETAASHGDRAGRPTGTNVRANIERGRSRQTSGGFMGGALDSITEAEEDNKNGKDGIGSDIFGALFGEGESIRKERETFEDLEAEYNKPANRIVDETVETHVTKSTRTPPATTAINTSSPYQKTYPTFFEMIDKKEGGGNYDTLLGHSQRKGGKFAGVKVSEMTLDQLYAFSNTKGAYAQWSPSQVKHLRDSGQVATPMGRYQFVGTTLRATAKAMGLPGNTVFSPKVQDAMAIHKLKERLGYSSSMSGKRKNLRSEWHGFHSVSNPVLDQIIREAANA